MPDQGIGGLRINPGEYVPRTPLDSSAMFAYRGSQACTARSTSLALPCRLDRSPSSNDRMAIGALVALIESGDASNPLGPFKAKRRSWRLFSTLGFQWICPPLLAILARRYGPGKALSPASGARCLAPFHAGSTDRHPRMIGWRSERWSPSSNRATLQIHSARLKQRGARGASFQHSG